MLNLLPTSSRPHTPLARGALGDTWTRCGWGDAVSRTSYGMTSPSPLGRLERPRTAPEAAALSTELQGQPVQG
jgi:hypothetical protein